MVRVWWPVVSRCVAVGLHESATMAPAATAAVAVVPWSERQQESISSILGSMSSQPVLRRFLVQPDLKIYDSENRAQETYFVPPAGLSQAMHELTDQEIEEQERQVQRLIRQKELQQQERKRHQQQQQGAVAGKQERHLERKTVHRIEDTGETLTSFLTLSPSTVSPTRSEPTNRSSANNNSNHSKLSSNSQIGNRRSEPAAPPALPDVSAASPAHGLNSIARSSVRHGNLLLTQGSASSSRLHPHQAASKRASLQDSGSSIRNVAHDPHHQDQGAVTRESVPVSRREQSVMQI